MSGWAWASCPANGICAIGRYRIVADFDVGHHQLFGMNMHNRAILIVGGVVVAAVIAGAVTLLFYEKQEDRDCVALMWDRKHPVEVRQGRSMQTFANAKPTGCARELTATAKRATGSQDIVRRRIGFWR